MKVNRVCAAVAAATMLAAGAARAEVVVVSGSGTWGPSAPTSALSAPGETWSFSFTVSDTPIGVGGPSGEGFDVPSSAVSAVSTLLGGASTGETFTDAQFFFASEGGGVDVNFSHIDPLGTSPIRDALSLYSPTSQDFGSDGVLKLGSYAVDAELGDPLGDAPDVGDGAGTVTIADLPVVSSAPEPGTWAMLLAGVAIMGATLRRRRASGSMPEAHMA